MPTKPMRGSRPGPGSGVVVRFPGTNDGRRVYNGRTMQPVPDSVDQPKGPIRLGDWTLHPDRNLLESSDTEHRLEPKAVDALLVLIEHDGGVVTKNELIDRVWESRIISEGTLTNTIAELRRALGDDARNPSYIETIPKRGYRLVCAIEPATEEHLSTNGSAPTRHVRRLVLAAVGLATIIIAATLMWLRPTPLADDHVLATPFANRTGEPDLDAFSSLARDRILAELTGSGIAHPIPVDRPVAGSLADACRVAADNGAGLAIIGTFYLHDGDVEIQAQLVDVAERELLYAVPPVIGSRADISASIEMVIQRMLGALAIHRSAHAHATLLSRPPVFEAYREFIAGSELYVNDLTAATGHLERAVELDPDFTSAQFRLAMAYKAAFRAPEGREILDRLHTRRGELTEFERMWLDVFLTNFEGRWADSLAALETIADMAPPDWTLFYVISSTALAVNRPGYATGTLEMLHEKDLPGFVTRHPMYANSFVLLAGAHHRLGDHAAELAAAIAGRKEFSTAPGLMAAEARARAAVGDADGLELLMATAEVARVGHRSASVLTTAAASARAHGHPALATSLADRAVEAAEREPVTYGHQALILGRALVQAGRLDRAQAVLTDASNMLEDGSGTAPIKARGWLGVIAARRGDTAIAEAAARELGSEDDPYLYGLPEYYRAAIAAWRGDREGAVELLRQARALGWSRFYILHDDERVLFEPLEGMAGYDVLLRPGDDG